MGKGNLNPNPQSRGYPIVFRTGTSRQGALLSHSYGNPRGGNEAKGEGVSPLTIF